MVVIIRSLTSPAVVVSRYNVIRHCLFSGITVLRL